MDNHPITLEPEDMSNDFLKICHFCSRVFSSGKALGGHIRIHIHPPNNKSLSTARCLFSDHRLHMKHPICRICGKNFPSMKSLFGHMRCHPDRGWKGIDPPLKMNSSNSSEVEDDHPDVESSEKDFSSVDLASSLKMWPVTAKRGRKAVLSAAAPSNSYDDDDDDQVRDAGKFLMMLSRGEFVAGKGAKTDRSDNYKDRFMIKNRRVLDFDLNQMVESEEDGL